MKTEDRKKMIESDPRWTSLKSRDHGADGTFYYSVATTGVYCRPSCGSRLPRPENVRFYGSREDAERAGFRPCKRCKPDTEEHASAHASKIAAACRAIEESETAPSLATLAQRAGLSVYHFHRLFKAATGVTPKQYAAAHRAKRVRGSLEKTATVTEAIYDSGYNSNGRFYAESNQLLGMTPSSYKAGGKESEIRFAIGESSLGSILVARSRRGVCAILLGDNPEALARDLQDRFPKANLIGADAEFETLVARVVGLVEHPSTGLDLPRRRSRHRVSTARVAGLA